MSTDASPTPTHPDPQRLYEAMNRITDQSQRVMRAFIERQASRPSEFNPLDPAVVSKAYQELWANMLTDPGRLVEAQVSLWEDYARLWENTARRLAGEDVEPLVEPEPGDRRFKDDTWSSNPLYDHIKQSYLLASNFVLSTVRETDGLDAQTALKVDFYTRQFVDALAPTNFVMTNPEVAERTVETGGENLVQGLSNLLEDLERGQGRLRIKMTDLENFELGENVAVTPGKVVFENDLMQLLQYTPTTEMVRTTPLLIVPPWINKYYILDLRPKNSFIKWAVDQGHTVFVISWVNPDERLAEKSMDDYLLEGPIAALDAIEQATGESRVNMVGYCLGGTLLATTLAYLKAVDRGPVIESATFLTTLVDFEEPGDLGVFIDEEQIAVIEGSMEEKGYFDGAKMAEAFNLLRANDLIWSFVVNNYLMGKEPFPFDLLYWNSDSTNMPRVMHSFYLRDMYQENRLREPGGITLDGVPIDLSTIDVPVYLLSTREDHIAPWRSTYAATRLYGGPIRFVLAMSGHVAGVVNPPSANKYGYYTGDVAPTPEEWLEVASAEDGSWWSDWDAWVREFGGGETAAREPGAGGLPAIEDAPGRYVKVQIP